MLQNATASGGEFRFTKFFLVNRKWFIDTGLTHIVAFRRDYIVGLGTIEKALSGDNAKMKIHTVEGAIVKASSGNGTIADLRNWFRSPPMK